MDAVWADACSARPTLPSDLLPSVSLRPAHLQNYAASLLRGPDGVWRVARDRVGPHPGAALLEAPMLAAFLPALCRVLLGRPLLLPSVPAWRYADPATAARLAAAPCRHTIRDGFDPASPVVPVASLPPVARVALQAAVDRAPHRYLVACTGRSPNAAACR